MAVSFEEAVDTLHKMFSSSGYDKQTLAQMLQRQNYHMENTVEEILKLEGQAGNPGEDTSGDHELAKKLAAEMDGYPDVMQPAGPVSFGSGAPKGRGTPVTLPDDFLRIPGYVGATEQQLSDEQLARMLQNEMFMEELQRDAELSRYVRGGAATSGSGSTQTQSTSDPNKPSMLTRLGTMGASARERLNAMAVRFNSRNKNDRVRRVGGNQYEHVPLNNGSLVDDDDEDVEVQFDNGIQMDAIRSPLQEEPSKTNT